MVENLSGVYRGNAAVFEFYYCLLRFFSDTGCVLLLVDRFAVKVYILIRYG